VTTKQGLGAVLMIVGALSLLGAGLLTMTAMWTRFRITRLRGRRIIDHSGDALSSRITARTWLLMIGAACFSFGCGIFASS
jgi:hypothetical protein